jgi:xylulokinase
MSVEPTFLGIDLGTSSVKVILTDRTGRELTSSSAEYSISRPEPDWAEIDPEDWWVAIGKAVHRVLAAKPSARPAGIGLSGQMHGVVLCGADGTTVRPAILWADARAEAELDVYRQLPEPVRNRLANPLSPGMAGPQLAWLQRHEPGSMAAARWAVQPKDWIRARLTGRFAAEPSDASATLLYDVLRQDWDDDVVAALNIRRELLPDQLAFAGVKAGDLLPQAADDLGLRQGITIAAGASDTAAAMLGAGLVEPGVAQLTIGTGVQVVMATDPPTSYSVGSLAPPVTHLYRSATPNGWYAMAAGLNGGQTLDWVRGILGVGWSELYAAAERPPLPDDPIFLPHLVGERTPYLDTHLRGAWTSLSARHDRPALLYAALEGVAFAVADTVDALPGITKTGRCLRLAGGGTTAPGWRQLLANVLNASLDAVEAPNASARGAALLGAKAAGSLAEPELMEAITQHVTRIADPGPARVDLAERRSQYLQTLNALRRPHRRST